MSKQKKNGMPPSAPKITGQVLRSREKEGGALAGLLSKLGFGGSGAASGVSAAGGGLLATKTGILAVVVAGSSVAAGIGYLATQGSDSSGGPSRAGRMFSAAARNAGSETMAGTREALEASRQAQNAVPSDGVSNSLDYFNTANKGAVGEEGAAEGADEGEAVAYAAASADGGSETVSDLGGGATGNATKAAASRPKMVKSKGFKSRSGGKSKLRLASQKGLSGGIGGGFDKTYKRPPKGASAGAKGSRSRQGARRRSSVMRGGASRQALNTNRVTRGSLRGPNLSSAGAGRTYDGGSGSLGAAGAGGGTIGGAGAGTGGAGVDQGSPNPNTVQNMREVPAPAEIKDKDAKNVTKYQGILMAAVAALAIAAILLFFANREATAATKASLTPAEKLAHASAAKTLAGFAVALAGFATAIGLVIAFEGSDQQMQGVLLAAAGGWATFKAGQIFLDDTAAETAQAEQKALDLKAKQEADALLNSSGDDILWAGPDAPGAGIDRLA